MHRHLKPVEHGHKIRRSDNSPLKVLLVTTTFFLYVSLFERCTCRHSAFVRSQNHTLCRFPVLGNRHGGLHQGSGPGADGSLPNERGVPKSLTGRQPGAARSEMKLLTRTQPLHWKHVHTPSTFSAWLASLELVFVLRYGDQGPQRNANASGTCVHTRSRDSYGPNCR